MPLKRNYLYIIGLLLGFLLLLVAGLFYYYFDPSEQLLAPKCPFWLLTGWHCPGCGGGRAVHAWLHGHLWEGFMFNPILLILLPYLLLMLYLRGLKGDRYFPKLANALDGNVAIISLVLLLIVYTVLRNIYGF